MNRIKDLREDRDMTQSDLGELLNVQKAAVSKYEMGKVSLSDELIGRLCVIFGVSADYLLCRTDEKNAINNSKKTKSTQSGLNLSDLEFALLGEVHNLSNEEKQELLTNAQRMNEVRKLKKREK